MYSTWLTLTVCTYTLQDFIYLQYYSLIPTEVKFKYTVGYARIKYFNLLNSSRAFSDVGPFLR